MEIWKPNDSGETRNILLTYVILKSELGRNYIDFSSCAKCTTLSRANIALIQCDGDLFGEQSWERFFFSRNKYFHSSIVCGIDEITIRKKLYRIFYQSKFIKKPPKRAIKNQNRITHFIFYFIYHSFISSKKRDKK